MHKQINLVDSQHIPQDLQNMSTAKKYEYLEQLYKSGKTHILLNNIRIFGPYPRSEVPWDISEAEKVVIYNKDVAKVNMWLKNEIFNKSALFNYKTLDVLIRIATGMLNKCDIPKELQIMFHDNMIENLKSEYSIIATSDLPF